MFGSKILVEIYDKTGLKQRKKFPIEGNSVLIRAGRRGPGGLAQAPTFDEDCVVYFYSGWWPFKQLKRKLLWKEGAERFINFRAEPEGFEMPQWDRRSEEEFFKASVIKAAGATVSKLQVPALLYVLIFANIALTFIGFLVSSGRVRI